MGTIPDIFFGVLRYDVVLGTLLSALGLLTAATVLGLAVWRRHAHMGALRASRLQATLANAELELLRTRLQPHFLFNTLHGISCLMQRDVAAARHMIALLADSVRGSLTAATRQTSTLRAELDSLDHFVQLQRMRFGERLQVEYRVDDGVLAVQVPRLVLQPLVEPALRHAPAHGADTAEVRVDAWCELRHVHIVVQITGIDQEQAGRGSADPEGGRPLVQARLREFYGTEQALILETSRPGTFVARLMVPLTMETEMIGS